MNRSFPIILACILLFVSALGGILVGLLLILGGGFLIGLIEEVGGGLQEQIAVFGIYAIGIGALIWSSFELAASYGLWKLKRWGAYLALILLVLSTLISISLWNVLSIIDVLFSGFIIFLIIIGWKNLTPRASKTA